MDVKNNHMIWYDMICYDSVWKLGVNLITEIATLMWKLMINQWIWGTHYVPMKNGGPTTYGRFSHPENTAFSKQSMNIEWENEYNGMFGE